MVTIIYYNEVNYLYKYYVNNTFTTIHTQNWVTFWYCVPDNQLREVENNQRIVKEEVKNDVSEHGNYSKNSSVPRAIRGSGALDKSKKGINVSAKSNSLRTTPPREKNKGWGHDDRFHEHYE